MLLQNSLACKTSSCMHPSKSALPWIAWAECVTVLCCLSTCNVAEVKAEIHETQYIHTCTIKSRGGRQPSQLLSSWTIAEGGYLAASAGMIRYGGWSYSRRMQYEHLHLWAQWCCQLCLYTVTGGYIYWLWLVRLHTIQDKRHDMFY